MHLVWHTVQAIRGIRVCRRTLKYARRIHLARRNSSFVQKDASESKPESLRSCQPFMNAQIALCSTKLNLLLFRTNSYPINNKWTCDIDESHHLEARLCKQLAAMTIIEQATNSQRFRWYISSTTTHLLCRSKDGSILCPSCLQSSILVVHNTQLFDQCSTS